VAHQTDPPNFSGQWTKPCPYFHIVLIQKTGPNGSFIDPVRDLDNIQLAKTGVTFVNEHL
jgi:hypothetical protein